MTKRPSNRYYGGYQLSLFDDSQFQSINTVSRDDADIKLQHLYQQLKDCLDKAFDKVSASYELAPYKYDLVPDLFAKEIYAECCINLKMVPGLEVYQGTSNGVCIEVMGEGIRIWFRKFQSGKHLLRPNSKKSMLKLLGKTDDDDIRPIIIMGYTSAKNQKGYVELCLTQQRQDHLEWEISIPEELRKKEVFLPIGQSDNLQMVADDNDILVTVKEGAKPRIAIND